MRPRSVSILVILLMLAVGAVSVRAQGPSNESGGREDIIPKDLGEFWVPYRTAIQRGDEAAALELLTGLNNRAKALGIENAEAISTAVLRDASEALDKGRNDFALDLSRASEEISPDFPASYFFRGRAYFRSDPFNFIGQFDEFFKGWSRTFRHLWSILFTIQAGTFWLMVTGLTAFLVFVFSLVLRYTPRISHLIFEWANQRLYHPTIYLLVAVLLVGPLWFGLGLVWAIIWWLIIFWVFMTFQERMIALLFVVVTATAGFWLPAWISVGTVKESPDFRVIAHAVGGEPGLPEKRLAAGANEGRNDGLLALARGIQFRRSKRYGEAKAEFKQAMDALPGDERVLLNLGNISFYENNIKEAMNLYQKALDINPGFVEAHYNMAQASREKLLFEEGEKQYEEAKRLDPKKTESYTARSAIEGGQPVIDAPIRLSEALLRAATYRTEDILRKSDQLFTLLWSSSISSAPLIGLLFGAVLMLLSPRGYIKRLSFQCALCGRMICHSCQKHIFHLRVCDACSEQNKNVKRFSELRQLQQRRDREILIARLVTILVPGTGHLYLMQSIRGFFFAFVFAAMVIGYFGEALPFFVPYAWMVSAHKASIFMLSSGLLVLYGFVFWDLARLKDLLGEEELWH